MLPTVMCPCVCVCVSRQRCACRSVCRFITVSRLRQEPRWVGAWGAAWGACLCAHPLPLGSVCTAGATQGCPIPAAMCLCPLLSPCIVAARPRSVPARLHRCAVCVPAAAPGCPPSRRVSPSPAPCPPGAAGTAPPDPASPARVCGDSRSSGFGCGAPGAGGGLDGRRKGWRLAPGTEPAPQHEAPMGQLSTRPRAGVERGCAWVRRSQSRRCWWEPGSRGDGRLSPASPRALRPPGLGRGRGDVGLAAVL